MTQDRTSKLLRLGQAFTEWCEKKRHISLDVLTANPDLVRHLADEFIADIERSREERRFLSFYEKLFLGQAFQTQDSN